MPAVAAAPQGELAKPAEAKPAGSSVFSAKTSAKSGTGGPKSATIDVFDQDTTKKAGGNVLAFRLTPGKGEQAGPVSLSIDYSGFEFAYGGDWISRVRLLRFQDCGLTTPTKDECGKFEEFSIAVDEDAKTLTFEADALPAAGASDSQDSSTRSQAGGGGYYVVAGGANGSC